ncbi:energy transducer TonB [uncultured Thiocystis sp.]|jgi:protein TonB|uniref:energy transducer TonB n=1 Tax=uncultured Thiocystis sp. TaxID=1202134 RepID=UPI0025DA595F|nr:energy transducer TonB [uncultured Thiocystis sp.]
MKGLNRCRRCVWLGLLCSAVIHVAIAAALLRIDAPTSTASAERIVNLDLARFGAGEDGEPVGQMAALLEPKTAVGASDPALVQEQPFEPEPEARNVLEPVAPPLPVQPPLPLAPEATTNAKLESGTKAPSRPPAAVKPKPKPVAKSKPQLKSKPTVKPSATADKPAPPTSAARSGASRDPRPDSGAASGTGQAAQPSGSGGKSASASRDRGEQEYLTALRQAIARHQRYPMEARRRQQTGIATVAFVIRSDGRIDRIQLAAGSGQPALDRAALDTLRRLGRFKPIPTALGRQSWPLRVPIRFDLK